MELLESREHCWKYFMSLTRPVSRVVVPCFVNESIPILPPFVTRAWWNNNHPNHSNHNHHWEFWFRRWLTQTKIHFSNYSLYYFFLHLNGWLVGWLCCWMRSMGWWLYQNVTLHSFKKIHGGSHPMLMLLLTTPITQENKQEPTSGMETHKTPSLYTHKSKKITHTPTLEWEFLSHL